MSTVASLKEAITLKTEIVINIKKGWMWPVEFSTSLWVVNKNVKGR